MSRALLSHPDIQAYTTIWMDSLRDGQFQLANTNKLIRTYPGAIGLKTGSTDSALYCLSAAAERDGMALIAVVLGSPTSQQRFDSAASLLDFGFANYTLLEVYPDQALPPVDVLLGEVSTVQPALSRPARVLVDKLDQDKVQTEVELCADVAAPVEEGQTLGKMVVYVDGVEYDSIPIVALQPVERLTFGGIFQRLWQRMCAGQGA